MKKLFLTLMCLSITGPISPATAAAAGAETPLARIANHATNLRGKVGILNRTPVEIDNLARDLQNTENINNTSFLSQTADLIAGWLEEGRQDFFDQLNASYNNIFELSQDYRRELEQTGTFDHSGLMSLAQSTAALNNAGSTDWLSKIIIRPGADRIASDNPFAPSYARAESGQEKAALNKFKAAKHLLSLLQAVQAQRETLNNLRARIALEKEATDAAVANRRATELASVAGQLAVTEAQNQAQLAQIQAQGDVTARVAELQQPTLIAQHQASVAADKEKHAAALQIENQKHAASLVAEKEQQEARLKARTSLVQYLVPALTIATVLGTAGYFAIRHYYQPRPTIIERADTSMLSLLDKWRGFKVPASHLDLVILEPALAQQVIGKFAGIVLAIQKGFPLSNMMFSGPPGTGKTMAAQAFARRLYEQGVANHVIVRGPAFKRLGSASKAQTALADVLRWSSKSDLPVILVFDEAETMFPDRDSEFANEMTNDLTTTILSFFERGIHDKMMFILSTNYPKRIDKALLNRIDGSNQVEFTLPGQKEREDLLESYVKQHFTSRGLHVSEEIHREKAMLAQKMEGLAGRQIDSLIAQAIYAVLSKGDALLDVQTLERVIAGAQRSKAHNQPFEPEILR